MKNSRLGFSMKIKKGENMKKKPELLAPAGSVESVYAAVKGGCDAVYIGGKNFSARHFANNIEDDDLEKIIDYCHLRNVKVFVALNTLYKNNEIKEVIQFAGKVYAMGADAFIVQDIGTASILRENFKDIQLHASTQMTAHSISDVQFLAENGFSRVILSRELSIEDIEKLSGQALNCEIECFVHGALCVSYSGQCLMSSMLGGRSANRGKCAGTCRLSYSLYKDQHLIDSSYLLSTKDLMTLNLIPQLVNLGIDSFKIEGRMKSPEYVGLVTSLYRKYIDLYFEQEENFEIEDEDIRRITQVFNRGGVLSEGYYTNHSGSDMISTKTPKSTGTYLGKVLSYDKKNGKCVIRCEEALIPGDGIEIWTKNEPHVGTNINKAAYRTESIYISIEGDISEGDLVYKSYDKKLMDDMKRFLEQAEKKVNIFGKFTAKKGEPVVFTVWDSAGVEVTISGERAEKSENRPMTAESLRKQLDKTGNTVFKFENIDFDIEDDIFINITALNGIRRSILEALSVEVVKSYKRSKKEIMYPTVKGDVQNTKKISATVLNRGQFDACVSQGVDRIYVEMTDDFLNNQSEYVDACKEANIELYMAFPRINRENNVLPENLNVDGFLLRNWGNMKETKALGLDCVADYTLNIYNDYSEAFFENNHISLCTISPELNLNEINEFSSSNNEIIVYGKIPLMLTHQCPIGLYDGGKTSGKFCSLARKNKDNYYLLDRKNVKFPLITDCKNCVCQILNANSIFLLNKMRDIKNCNATFLRLNFTTEDKDETIDVIYSYKNKLMDEDFEDFTTERLLDRLRDNLTNGHLYRGV